MGKISTVLDAERDITDRPGARELGRIDGRLELDRVVFAYGDEPVIHGLELDDPGGRLHRARRRVGRRQVDDGEARRAVLRPGERRGPRRRRRPPRRRAPLLPPPARGRAPGSVPLQRDDRRQHPLRAARGDRRGGRGGGAGDRRRPGRRAVRGGPRARRPRGRRRALGRRAPADLDRARARRRPAHPDPRRGDLEHRPAERGAHRARRSTPCSAAGRRSSSRTASRRCGAPTRSSCSSAGGSPSAGRYDELMAADGPFRRLATTLHGAAVRNAA